VTAPDPRLGEIERRANSPFSLTNSRAQMDADRDYLLTELRKRDEVIARVAVIERRLERSNQGEDREIAEDLRAAVTAAKGDGE